MKKYISLVFTILAVLVAALLAEEKPSKWLPDYAKMQYAGNIGWLSLGGGYEFLLKTLQTDLMYGFVPKAIGGKEIHSLTLKVTVVPGRFYIGKGIEVVPLQFGAFANFAIGDNYVLIWPGYYPRNYYYSTSFNSGEFIGFRIGKDINSVKNIQKIDLYAEISTLTVYLQDYLVSDYLEFSDIFSLSIGVTVYPKW